MRVLVWTKESREAGKGLPSRMAENSGKLPLFSVQIMLPEALDRRLARRTEDMQGASWPARAGHITLVPGFVPLGTIEEVRAAIESVCSGMEPFTLRFGAPVAVPDLTRPDYFAAMITVENGGTPPPNRNGQSDEQDAATEESGLLQTLRKRLLAALEALREDMQPKLLEGPFLPHVTLALGLSESEALTIVRELRAEPIAAEFEVAALWLVMKNSGDKAQVERQPIPLGRVAAREVEREG
jgi:2'-5' RNA ligase